jgi:hypothetical protein
MITERSPPTLWSMSLDDEVRMKLALEGLENENRRLKDLVISLSETILRNIGNAPSNCQKASPERHVCVRQDFT